MNMDPIDRRKFLKFVGMGSGIAIAGTVASNGILSLLGKTGGGGATAPNGALSARGNAGSGDAMQFRAIVGLPALPLPAYASYVLEGSVNPVTRSGVVSRTVFAGAPGAMSDIALPGLSQTIRVTDVRPARDGLRIQGFIGDRSQVGPGESQTVEILVDRARGIVRAPFSGSKVTLSLQA